MSGDPSDDLKTEIRVPFPSAHLVQIAFDVLRVDAEPSNVIERMLSIDGTSLVAVFTARDPGKLRVAVNGFFSNLLLVTETLQAFGPPASTAYSHYQS